MDDESYNKFDVFLSRQPEGSLVFDFVNEILFQPKDGCEPAQNDEVAFSDNPTGIETNTLTWAAPILGYTIFRVAKIFLNTVNNRLELKEAERRMDLCRSISKEQRMPLDIVEKMLARTLDVIAKRGEKDSAFQEILSAVKPDRKK